MSGRLFPLGLLFRFVLMNKWNGGLISISSVTLSPISVWPPVSKTFLMSVPRAADRGRYVHAASFNSRLFLLRVSTPLAHSADSKENVRLAMSSNLSPVVPRAGHAGHTELSFTKPLTESSCRESWLARPSMCMVRLCVRGLPAPSILGGEGASSGVRN